MGEACGSSSVTAVGSTRHFLRLRDYIESKASISSQIQSYEPFIPALKTENLLTIVVPYRPAKRVASDSDPLELLLYICRHCNAPFLSETLIRPHEVKCARRKTKPIFEKPTLITELYSCGRCKRMKQFASHLEHRAHVKRECCAANRVSIFPQYEKLPGGRCFQCLTSCKHLSGLVKHLKNGCSNEQIFKCPWKKPEVFRFSEIEDQKPVVVTVNVGTGIMNAGTGITHVGAGITNVGAGITNIGAGIMKVGTGIKTNRDETIDQKPVVVINVGTGIQECFKDQWNELRINVGTRIKTNPTDSHSISFDHSYDK